MNKHATNSNLIKIAFIVFGLALAPQHVFAEWTGNISGGSDLDGDDKQTRIGITFQNLGRPFSQQIEAEWVRDESELDTYQIVYEPKYWFSDHTYTFGEAGVKIFGDPSVIDQERSFGAGVGIQLVRTKTQNLYAEAGVFQRSTVLDDSAIPSARFDDSDLLTGIEIGGSQKLLDLLRLQFETAYLVSDLAERGVAEIGISFRLSNGAIKYTYRYLSDKIGDSVAVNSSDSMISVNYGF